MAPLLATKSNMPCPAAGSCKNFSLRPISNGFFSTAIACLKKFSNRQIERQANQSAASPLATFFGRRNAFDIGFRIELARGALVKTIETIIDKAMRLIARGLAANRLKTVASGLANIPAHGLILIVARHYHHLYDGLALRAVLPRPVTTFLPFKAGFVNIASAAERCLCGKVPIIPAGLRYDEEKPWIGHIAFGEAIYRDKFSTKLELITFMERKVKNLSGITCDKKS